MKRYAILIGSSRFDKEPKLNPLRCPENDVDGMHEIVSAAELGAFTETFVYKNTDNQTILNQIAGTLSDASNEDQVLIYYSGHGKRGRTGQLYLTTANTENRILHTTSIPLPSLREIFADSDCKKIALILDCCFAGAAGEAFKSDAEEKLKEFSSGNGIYLLTASTANQTAIEKESDDYSLLTKHIINGVKSGAAARPNSAHISIEDLYNYVHRQVIAEGHQQPMRWALNVRGEELIIARVATGFSAQRLKAFKEVLHEKEEEIDDEVYLEAIRVIKENQPMRDKASLDLLADLCDGRLSPGKFSGKWLRLVRPRSDLVETLTGLLTVKLDEPVPIIASVDDMPDLIKLMGQVVAAVERGMKITGRGDSFPVALRAGFLAVAERYPFLDPFRDEFEYKNEEIKFTGSAEPNEFVMGVLNGLNQVVEDLHFSTKSREVARPIANELSKIEQAKEDSLSRFNLKNLTERICKM